ncbi:hypothetical protein QR77_37305 [Streptomyces sp. 150FB]|uniref:nuclear transport factor 2 family protein n=1 Tax=Streptomyces sp. 150FB TaxID=1576605 RepID=UPI000589030E|nr:nuclear transport factor 2 family protein [Streptomyces sp. 150FB]KIF77961.1 hypothetical protein QR77_37305 [Streptomyces sp. 150FB]
MAMTALDHEGIRQLLARYSLALDFGDTATLAACFAPEGRFDETGLPPEPSESQRFEGRPSIAAFAARFYEHTRGTVRHWASQPVVEGDGRDATGVAFLMVLRPGTAPRTGVVLTGVYRDRYTKIDDRWHFAAREFTADPQPGDRETAPADPLVNRFDDFVAGRPYTGEPDE